MQRTRQTHANTPRHEDPCDDWQTIGTYIRAEVERVEAAIEQRKMLEEFVDADAHFVTTYTRFRG